MSFGLGDFRKPHFILHLNHAQCVLEQYSKLGLILLFGELPISFSVLMAAGLGFSRMEMEETVSNQQINRPLQFIRSTRT
nr:hypothetical protein Iba_chr07dCG12050 [Ipomoea batatas]